MTKKGTVKHQKPRDTLLRWETVIFDREIQKFKNSLSKSLSKAEKLSLVEEEKPLLASRIKNSYYGTKENNGKINISEFG
jgi:hypothetical protein